MRKSLLQLLYDEQSWHDFLLYKQESGNISRQDKVDLERFICGREYEEILAKIKQSGFSIPRKKIISKVQSSKKRVVYVFPREENYIQKLLTFLLIRRYDYAFAKNLYSFRACHGVRSAVAFLKKTRDLSAKYVYKADIHDYFNSVDITLLLPRLKKIMVDDMGTYSLIEELLTDSRVILSDGSVVSEVKGIMAGMPLSAFLANVYLSGLDNYFQRENMLYARYSDDIILFTSTEKEREALVEYLHAYLKSLHLTLNPSKEEYASPGQKWNFLGISYQSGVFDISEVSATKLKKKMRRKSRALLRWKSRKGLSNENAAKAFVKVFDRKLYNNLQSELTWTRWFFPVINTTETLSQIDHYMQDCLRYIATEKRNSTRFKFTYEEMKRLGYRSLVHEYYLVKSSKTDEVTSKVISMYDLLPST